MAYGFSNQANNISHFIKHSDNNIYMVGYVDDTLQTNADILLIKVDTAGNEIWKKKIGVTGMDENALSIDTLKGNLIIGGYKTIHNTSSSSGFVIRIDTAGNTIWNKNVYTNLGGGCIIKTLKDGNVLVYSQYKQYSIGSDDYYRLQVEKITSNNISIWQKRYNVATINSGPSNAIENSDGHIIIAGQKGYADISVKGTVNVINQNGDSLFYKEFYNEQGSQNYFRDVIQADDKGYCFAGFIIPVVANGGTGTEDIWLLKVDSNFCESAIPCNNNVGLSEVEALEATVRVYPNPSNGSFVIEIANEAWLTKPLALTLTDCVGNNVYSATITHPTSTIQTESLANGIYFLTLQTKDKKVTKKIIIQK